MLGISQLCFLILDSLSIIVIIIMTIKIRIAFINPLDHPFQLHLAFILIISIVIFEFFNFSSFLIFLFLLIISVIHRFLNAFY